MKLQELEEIVQPSIMQGLTELELQLHRADFNELKQDLVDEHVNASYGHSLQGDHDDTIELSYQGAIIYIKQLQ